MSLQKTHQAIPLEISEVLDALESGWRIPLALHPQGKHVAYCLMQSSRKQPMLEEDHYRSQTGVFAEVVGNDIWLASLPDGPPRNLTEGQGSNFAPAWSPDGNSLAFVSDRDGTAGLWLYENEAFRRVCPEVVWMGVGFERAAWHPDGQSILVKLLPPSVTIAQAAAIENPSQARPVDSRQSSPRVYEFDPSVPDVPETAQYNRKMAADLCQVEVESGKVVRLVKTPVCSGWWVSPDGNHLAYTTFRERKSSTSQLGLFDLHVLNLENGQSKILPSPIPSDFGMGVSWSPDSRRLAYCTMNVVNDYSKGDVYVVSADGDEPPSKIASGDYFNSHRGPNWLDETTLLLHSPQGLERAKLDGTKTVLTSEAVDGVVGQPESGRPWVSDGLITAILEDGTATFDLESGERGRGSNARPRSAVGTTPGMSVGLLTHPRRGEELVCSWDGFATHTTVHRFNPQYREESSGHPRLLDYRTAEGQKLQAALLLPPDYDSTRTYPMVVIVYGGRMGSKRGKSFGLEGPGCDNMHILASRGYIVMSPDIPIENNPVRDIVAAVEPAVEAAIDQGLADPERLAVMGHSYGGYTTLALITHCNLFRAAVDRAGISNLLNEYLRFDEGRSSFLAYAETGQGGMRDTPWTNLQRFIENSPVFHLDKAETPLLIIHGDQDNDAWVDESGQVFVGLRRLGKPVTYVSYPGEGHWEGTWSREHVLDYWQRVLSFLHKNGV